MQYAELLFVLKSTFICKLLFDCSPMRQAVGNTFITNSFVAAAHLFILNA